MRKRIMMLVLSCLMVLSAFAASPGSSYAAANAIRVNQVGYEKTYPKTAVVDWSSSGARPTSFEIIDASTSQSVFQGAIAAADWKSMTSWYSDRVFAKLDFTAFRTPGKYKIRIAQGGTVTSPAFDIDDALLFKKTFGPALDYFFKSRNAGAVWNADAKAKLFGSNPAQTRDVRGGWYDASGDISKYLSHLQYTNFMTPQQTPLVVWAMTYIRDRYPAQLDAIGKKSALEQEAAFGADFLVRMKANNPYFYVTVFDNWTGDLSKRYVAAYSNSTGDKSANYQAAFREGGGMAIAALAASARLGLSGEFTSADYLNAAVSAYAHLKTNNTSYTDNGVENIIDDYCALIAATELYKATNNQTYLTDARSRAASIVNRQHAEGWYYADGGSRPYYHAAEAGMPALALALYAQTDTASSQTANIDSIKNYINHLLAITGEVPNGFGLSRQVTKHNGKIRKDFFIPRQNESNYWWQGENARLSSLSAMSLIGGKYAFAGSANLPDTYRTYYADQLDWILGKNPYGISMLRGFGTNHPDYGSTKYGHTDLDGGISNGVHSKNNDGSGIDFIQSGGERWRSLEQWIPHAAWYMLAITSILDEVPVTPPPTGGNLALGKQAVASSIESAGFEASKAVDGNGSTRWASAEGQDPQWIYVDLGSSKAVSKVKLKWEAAYASAYKIQVSDNAAGWTDVYTTTSGNGGTDEVTFASQNARYVRVLGTARGTAYGYSLFEFEVYS
ncbi:discoidin domain-containing protein [Paenibacillus sp. A3]|uniref:galactose-binding domain-containing protein n=1 Tax=Paenibacillus sp. A3 TaxID=1337054 RepID=UPI0006D56EF8|nr:discoidin domain-containing protein [Paenibacillus sp. A3]